MTHNALLETMLSTLVGADVDIEPARIAFERTRGGFAARFAAAIEVQLAVVAKPEVVIDVAEHPEELAKAELAELVRPAATGFLRSYPTKGELLDELDRIKRRHERRPSWIPTVDRYGRPLPSAGAEEEPSSVSAVVASFPELGAVTVQLPTDDEDRPEVPVLTGGIGELEMVLHAVLGTVGAEGVLGELHLDAAANEALVPDETCWWPRQRTGPVPAAHDPGVASELLATCATLGGVRVVDDSPEVIARALTAAGDWRFSRRWRLDAWDPTSDAGVLVTARAAFAGWAHERGSGLILYASGGAFHAHEGLSGYPGPLHSHLLCVTRSRAGTDAIDAVHRVTLSCPGPDWCHRGGCAETVEPELDALLSPLIEAGQTSGAMTGQDEVAEAYLQLYGATGFAEYADSVLDVVGSTLSGAGWVELERSTWDGGLEDLLLRRAEHCVRVEYDPVTRRVRLGDGKPWLESSLDLLAEDGVLTGTEGAEDVDTGDEAVERWGTDLLTAAQDLLRGAIESVPHQVESTILGLHPHADGDLRGPESMTLATEQVSSLLGRVGLLGSAN
ncbi:hypothetical protein [Amycolatopsis australiensis]|uniref:hypothetical protein n=1 Tax=Amycolatopsis australiensis TaxID=546364 RepID=UPI001160FE44|nr:hypothetical protein [Amycolatopsis australiensis]